MNHRFTLTLLALAIGAAFSAQAADDKTPKPDAPGTAPLAPLSADLKTERHELDQMRDQMRELSRKMADLSAKLGDVGPRAYAYRYLGDPERGMVGVVFDGDDQGRGLRVKAVTPGGPADKAGIHNNDILVSVDGKSLANEKHDRALHGISLGEIKVDQTLKLGVLRDGKTSDISVKAERREPYNFAWAFGDNDGDNPVISLSKGDHPMITLGDVGDVTEINKKVNEQVREAVRQARVYERVGNQVKRSMQRFDFSTPWWGLNLVGLNSDLGGYFGTDKGVLVVSADEEEFKALKSGDVLQEVGGRKVERPEDALRLLREHGAGSEVKVQVLRQHKPITLSLTAPEFEGIFVPPPPPPPPTPPTPPSPRPPPPAPPAPAAPAPPAPPPPPPPPVHDAEA